VAEKVVGFADLAGARPTTLDSAYLWFSMTKIAAATAVMQLVERGALELDDPVERYLPELPRSPAASSATIHLRRDSALTPSRRAVDGACATTRTR
jgi:CubicO group peptidase (beta-lactamase class C family)